MHPWFVRPSWIRDRRSAGEMDLQPRSSNTHHLSRSRRHRQLRIPLGKTVQELDTHKAGSEQRMCSMWVCRSADIIASLIFFCQDYFKAYSTGLDLTTPGPRTPPPESGHYFGHPRMGA